MKKQFTVILLSLFSMIFVNCGQDERIEKYPLDLDVSDFSLTGTACNWNWPTLMTDTLFVINTVEEFVSKISCQNDNVPAIDFKKHSLLFTRGTTTSGVHSISKHLKQTSKNDYQLSIDVILNDATVAEGWRIVILTPKLSKNATIVLDVNQHH
jgi:hypothetical protein